MSHWIKVSNNNLCLILLRFFLTKLNSHSYGEVVFSQLCVDLSYMCEFLSL